ncbi:MAG: hypothetical protein F7C81_04580 [Desulfurococcales archaeon]|nr:hypothetical protein [Desulfurococcales archaeon]
MSSQPNHCLLVDSSVIIAFAEVNMVDVLVVLDVEIIVPHAVYEEVVAKGHDRPCSKELEDLAG